MFLGYKKIPLGTRIWSLIAKVVVDPRHYMLIKKKESEYKTKGLILCFIILFEYYLINPQLGGNLLANVYLF